MTRSKKVFLITTLVLTFSILLYLTVWIFVHFEDINGQLHLPHIQNALLRIIGRRSTHLVAIIIAGVLVAISSLSFQTITDNRILTPSVLGFDSIYAITQTAMIFFLGSLNPFFANQYVNFFISVTVMVGVTLIMYMTVLSKNKNNIILLLLIGMVISSLARSGVNFIQVLMDPDEFQSVTAVTSVSITNINVVLVWVTLPIAVILTYLFTRQHHEYDVMTLGEDQAINLGVDYHYQSKKSLILIAVSMAIATALVGPLSFLGLIAVNVAKELMKKHKHLPLMFLSSMVAIIFLTFGQAIIEITGYLSTVTVLISFVGGLYMIYLIIKENRA